MQRLRASGARRATSALTDIRSGRRGGPSQCGNRMGECTCRLCAQKLPCQTDQGNDTGLKPMEAKHSPSQGEATFPVVAIGASAGGLEAFRTLLAALPAESGKAFILVQHLDPTHESMMVELLSRHSAMTVLEARDGLRLEAGQVYIIPPGRYLAVRNGAIQLSPPPGAQTVRMPFDFLLKSLAEECGERAVCITLSGTGTDGSIGAKAIKDAGSASNGM